LYIVEDGVPDFGFGKTNTAKPALASGVPDVLPLLELLSVVGVGAESLAPLHAERMHMKAKTIHCLRRLSKIMSFPLYTFHSLIGAQINIQMLAIFLDLGLSRTPKIKKATTLSL
jgi:hypothetical protein